VVVLMGSAGSIAEKSIVILGIALTYTVTLIVLKFSDYIDRVLGITGVMVLNRVMGLILGAVAVNFAAVGAWNIYQSLAGG